VRALNLFKFLIIRTRQVFLTISTAESFSLTGVGATSSPSMATDDLRMLLRWSGEAATTYAWSESAPLSTWVISNSLFQLKLSLTIISSSLWEGIVERDLLVTLRVRSSFDAMLSNPLEILATMVSSSSSRAKILVPSNSAFPSISSRLR
jgi:hypothetical protein